MRPRIERRWRPLRSFGASATLTMATLAMLALMFMLPPSTWGQQAQAPAADTQNPSQSQPAPAGSTFPTQQVVASPTQPASGSAAKTPPPNPGHFGDASQTAASPPATRRASGAPKPQAGTGPQPTMFSPIVAPQSSSSTSAAPLQPGQFPTAAVNATLPTNAISTSQAATTPSNTAPSNPQPPQPTLERRQSQNPNAPFIFRKNVGEVILHATVLDDHDRSIRDLNKGEFSIFENNVRQQINFFSHEDAPVSIGILIDNSGSMRDKRAEVNQAAINFVKASNPGDEVFIVNFNDEYYLDADFTSSIPKLQEGLDKIESRGGTALYDALVASIDHLAKYGKRDKKVLLVVTDGSDNSSRYSLEQTVRTVEAEQGPIIYCIGIQSPDEPGSERRHASKALKALSTATGGVAYMPKDLAQVDSITRQVAADIRDQYTLIYHSNQHTPGFRAIRVEVHAPHLKHPSVRTRNGYWENEARASAAQP